MSLLIKGMEMPPSDKALIMAYKDGRFIWIDLNSEKTYQYKAVELPTPHGDLIERDAMHELLNWRISRPPFSRKKVRMMIEAAPTIIPAEEVDDDE